MLGFSRLLPASLFLLAVPLLHERTNVLSIELGDQDRRALQAGFPARLHGLLNKSALAGLPDDHDDTRSATVPETAEAVRAQVAPSWKEGGGTAPVQRVLPHDENIGFVTVHRSLLPGHG